MTARTMPPVLYLPVSEDSTETTQYVEIRQMADGRRGLLAFSALDRLTDRLGEDQAWVLMYTDRLPELRATEPFDVVVMDPTLTPADAGADQDGAS
jgi:hypothetical protein